MHLEQPPSRCSDDLMTLCPRGRGELAWLLPEGAQGRVRLEASRCGRTGQHHCSRLTLSPALLQDTGAYRCRYRNRTRRHSTIYVYVTGEGLPPRPRHGGVVSPRHRVAVSQCATPWSFSL